jgi:hypothetical protein
MSSLLQRSALAFACLALCSTVGFTSGCALLRAASHTPHSASAKSAKEIAACEKMCEVAGDAESNKGAVDRCKKDCR